MLFDFRLRKLHSIEPWGDKGSPTLHWLGLTDGEYWLNVGSKKILEYSNEVFDCFGGSRYCEYQVVRLYEDILEIAPRILESVPPNVSDFISGDCGLSLLSRIRYLEAPIEVVENSDDMLDAAGTWILERTLDTGYLSPGAGIVFWADDINVHVVWNNTDRKFEGLPAWSEEKGNFAIPRDCFLNELESFHQRLMSQMSLRVSEVLNGALGDRAQVDYEALQSEHEIRQRSIQPTVSSFLIPTLWEEVASAISKVQQIAGEA